MPCNNEGFRPAIFTVHSDPVRLRSYRDFAGMLLTYAVITCAIL